MNNFKNLFENIDPYTINESVFKIIDKDWMLVTAGKEGHFNMMTASWGTLGILWHRPIAVCFIRPQRYTFQFTEEYNYFTLCFFEEKYRKALQVCGTHSGKDTDKVKAADLKPASTELKNIAFEEARLIIECKKLYFDDLKQENFIIPEIALQNYPNKDYHRFYIGEIVKCYMKK